MLPSNRFSFNFFYSKKHFSYILNILFIFPSFFTQTLGVYTKVSISFNFLFFLENKKKKHKENYYYYKIKKEETKNKIIRKNKKKVVRQKKREINEKLYLKRKCYFEVFSILFLYSNFIKAALRHKAINEKHESVVGAFEGLLLGLF